MATSRDIRRLAFQTLFQLDATGGGDLDSVREHMDDSIREIEVQYSRGEKEKALTLAMEAYENRAGADATMLELAPTWPASRQAAVDRAILRLAHHEMTRTKTPPKVAVNEAVDLAKVFSTEKSPAFINGLLDKVLKKVLAERGPSVADDAAEQTAEPEQAVDPDQPVAPDRAGAIDEGERRAEGA